MSFAQKDRLDRIQHTLLPTTEKKFHRKRMKNDEIRAFLCKKCRSKNPGRKSGYLHKLEYNFLLTRKLAIGVNEKVVGQITTFQMSGQQALNSMSMGDYAYFCSQIQKSVKNVTVGPVPLKTKNGVNSLCARTNSIDNSKHVKNISFIFIANMGIKNITKFL